MSFKDNKEPRAIEDTIECVEALAKIVHDQELGRIAIKTEDFNITIENKTERSQPPIPMPIPTFAGNAPAAQPSAQTAEAANKPDAGKFVTSPIIGTFYSSPSPEKSAFVKVGDTVSAGDVLCIIESMKLMNEINSEFSGKVTEIYVNDGDTVEYGQKLMKIE